MTSLLVHGLRLPSAQDFQVPSLVKGAKIPYFMAKKSKHKKQYQNKFNKELYKNGPPPKVVIWEFDKIVKSAYRTSLPTFKRICLPTQDTWVQFLDGKIPYAAQGQLSPCATTTEPMCQLLKPGAPRAQALQQERPPQDKPVHLSKRSP